MTLPNIKLTKTMVDKYIIDAKVDVLKLFGVLVFPVIKSVAVFDPYTKTGTTTIRFYKTRRGDKRMSIKNLKKYANVGDYITFSDIAGTAHIKAMTVTTDGVIFVRKVA
jgi:hypothetical protein